MSARNFFRGASKRLHVFWNSLKCRTNDNVEDIRVVPEIADENIEYADGNVSVPVYQSASFSASRFAQMPLLPGEVQSHSNQMPPLPGEVPPHSNRCHSVMMQSMSNADRSTVRINRFVNPQRRARPRGARYGFSRQNMGRSVHHEVEFVSNEAPVGENAGMAGDNVGTDEERNATVGHVVGGGDVMVVEDVE